MNQHRLHYSLGNGNLLHVLHGFVRKRKHTNHLRVWYRRSNDVKMHLNSVLSKRWSSAIQAWFPWALYSQLIFPLIWSATRMTCLWLSAGPSALACEISHAYFGTKPTKIDKKRKKHEHIFQTHTQRQLNKSFGSRWYLADEFQIMSNATHYGPPSLLAPSRCFV